MRRKGRSPVGAPASRLRRRRPRCGFWKTTTLGRRVVQGVLRGQDDVVVADAPRPFDPGRREGGDRDRQDLAGSRSGAAALDVAEEAIEPVSMRSVGASSSGSPASRREGSVIAASTPATGGSSIGASRTRTPPRTPSPSAAISIGPSGLARMACAGKSPSRRRPESAFRMTVPPCTPRKAKPRNIGTIRSAGSQARSPKRTVVAIHAIGHITWVAAGAGRPAQPPTGRAGSRRRGRGREPASATSPSCRGRRRPRSR